MASLCLGCDTLSVKVFLVFFLLFQVLKAEVWQTSPHAGTYFVQMFFIQILFWFVCDLFSFSKFLRFLRVNLILLYSLVSGFARFHF